MVKIIIVSAFLISFAVDLSIYYGQSIGLKFGDDRAIRCFATLIRPN